MNDAVPDETLPAEERAARLVAQMTLDEKIGQLNQVHSHGERIVDELRPRLHAGQIGSVLNEVNRDRIAELQRIAVEESRLGIPLLFGRDVIHGFKTVMPIPLGQAASWNPALVHDAARIAAHEAATVGINWTFAPMMDLTRDPRWGRIAESLGEDALLASRLAVAMVEGLQGSDLAAPGSIAACAKHFAAYGAVESGRDYATTNVSEYELRNYYFHPFKAAVDAGVSTVMASFSDLNGIPATGNEFLMRDVLRDEWEFGGFVVSDWDSVRQLAIHGLTEDEAHSALLAAHAGVDMEMVGEAYFRHLPRLVREGQISEATIDRMVSNILGVKFRLGLFENPVTDPARLPPLASPEALSTARRLAEQSVVLLKNDNDVLPLAEQKLAIIGPLADAPYEQMGTWVFDGDPELSITPLQAIRERVGDDERVRYVRAMQTSRSRASSGFDEAVAAAAAADVAVLFLGEEAILSGEAHSRASIDLPGDQAELVRRIRNTGKPVVAVIMAGRPLTLQNIVDQVDAILFAWHPGSMGGPAIADLLFGDTSPSGKLPVTFPRMVGQIPIYYNQKNTGKPPSAETIVHIDDIDQHAPQTSFGMTAFHLDAGFTPLFPFGHGLSYTQFRYDQLRLAQDKVRIGDTVRVSVRLSNTGKRDGVEVVQLYVRDLVGSRTRPVRELKDFRRVPVAAGESVTLEFELPTSALAFYGKDMQLVTEPGQFHIWIGGSSAAELRGAFRLVD